MSNAVLQSPGIVEEAGGDTSDTSNVTITSGSSETKGSWVEMASSTSYLWDGFYLNVDGANGYNMNLDIGIGAAASETIVAASLRMLLYSVDRGGEMYIPIRVPSGSRVAVRASADGSSQTMGLQLLGVHKGMHQRGYSELVMDQGSDDASEGIEHDPGATADTKGSWTELVSSTSRPYAAILLQANNTVYNSGASTHLIDLAIGAAASETVIAGDLYRRSRNNVPEPSFWVLPCAIPSGSRLAVRHQSETTSVGARELRYTVGGLIA